MSDHSNSLTLPAADVHRWLAERARLEEQIREINDRLAAVGKLFPSFDLSAFATAQVTQQQASTIEITERTLWTDFVTFALSKANGGRTQRWMLEQGKGTRLAERIERSPNGLYNAVARMLGRGDLIREGDLFYLPALWNAIKSGATADIPDEGEEEPTFASVVMGLMADGKPRVAGQVIAHLHTHPVTSDSVKRNANYAYTVLNRLVKQKHLQKLGSEYALPQEADEPHNGISVGGSRASEGLHPSLNFPQPASSKAH